MWFSIHSAWACGAVSFDLSSSGLAGKIALITAWRSTGMDPIATVGIRNGRNPACYWPSGHQYFLGQARAGSLGVSRWWCLGAVPCFHAVLVWKALELG